jgi:hypothetical protein
MNFLAAVNRLLAAEGFLSGDSEEITTFSDLQHKATVRVARIAIQDELMELVSDSTIPYEKKTTGSITTVAGTRTYDLPSDFVRFYGTPALYESTGNRLYYEFPGGEPALRDHFPDYMTVQSDPLNWYMDLTTTKKIGFWYVPQEAKTYTFPYEADVSVTNSSDTLPFHTESEAQAFCRLAQRRFKWLLKDDDTAKLVNDPEHMKAKSTLFALIQGKPPSRFYNAAYK